MMDREAHITILQISFRRTNGQSTMDNPIYMQAAPVASLCI